MNAIEQAKSALENSNSLLADIGGDRFEQAREQVSENESALAALSAPAQMTDAEIAYLAQGFWQRMTLAEAEKETTPKKFDITGFARAIEYRALSSAAGQEPEELVTRESALQAIEHMEQYNGPGRSRDAVQMLVAAPAKPQEQPVAAQQDGYSERDKRVLRFALQMFASNARLHANAAAQDKRGWYKEGAVPAFTRDAEDAERLIASLNTAHPVQAPQQEASAPAQAAEGLGNALQRLERAVDLHLGRSSWTQTTHLKGYGYSEAVRKELFAAHDEARAALAASHPQAAQQKGEKA